MTSVEHRIQSQLVEDRRTIECDSVRLFGMVLACGEAAWAAVAGGA